MRIMLLSFKPNIYQKIYNGVKLFEHRRNFPDEPVLAYMYVSKPEKAIKGIIHLKNRHSISEWEKEYSYDKDALERIMRYKESYRYAMEIVEFQETTKIGLNKIKEDFPDFVVPQSYIYLDDKPELLKYIQDNLTNKEKNVKHGFSNIQSSQICVN